MSSLSDRSAFRSPTAGLKELRLLAVDLGLRTGLALYDGDGKLLSYAQYPSVQDALSLGKLAEEWLAGEGAASVQGADVSGGSEAACSPSEGTSVADAAAVPPALPVTHLAIEGGDVQLRDEWDAAALRVARMRGDGAQPAVQVEVSPDAWRRELLLPKERRNGNSAKAAARLIARQVVSERGGDGVVRHAGKFPTDAAEAVLIGYYAARRLGWCGTPGDKPVKRYMNGAIALPRP